MVSFGRRKVDISKSIPISFQGVCYQRTKSSYDLEDNVYLLFHTFTEMDCLASTLFSVYHFPDNLGHSATTYVKTFFLIVLSVN